MLRRTNGSLQIQQSFSVSLSLDPLTNDPELVGREIRNHLDAAGIRERHCVVGLPLKWALTTHVDHSRAAGRGHRQLPANRGRTRIPVGLASLHVCTSQSGPPAQHSALLAGIPLNHLAALEQALRAAKLRPHSFGIGVTALQPPAVQGVVALLVGETSVGLQVSIGGGVAALRTLEGALENEGGRRRLHAELVAREARITLGQLPAEIAR